MMKKILLFVFISVIACCIAQPKQSLKYIYPEPKVIDFPSIYITVEGRLNAVDKIPATYRLEGEIGNCAIELHGNSSLQAAKKSYDFSFRTVGTVPTNGKFPGLPWTKDILFISNFYDPSMMRNVIAYSTWEALGHRTPAFNFCHLYINDVYEGMHLVVEKIRSVDQLIDKPRWKPNHSNLSQPFFMRIDWENEGEVPVSGMREYPIYAEMLDPKPYRSIPNYHSIQDYLEEMNEALSGKIQVRKDSLRYSDIIDVESFVDYFLLNEWTKNPDAYRSSIYFYTSEESKITMGPVWDFDLAFANPLNPEDDAVEGWIYQKKLPESSMKTMPTWWYNLMCDPSFRDLCLKRMDQLEVWLNSEEFKALIRTYSEGIDAKLTWEIKRWGRANEFSTVPGPLSKSNGEEVQEILDFLQKRLVWMKENLLNQPCISPFAVMAEYEEYSSISPNELERSFTVEFGMDLSSGLRMPGSRYQYYSGFSFVLLDDRGNEKSSGAVSGTEMTLPYNGWASGNYYLIVTENGHNSFLATSAPILTRQFMYKLVVP